MTPAARRFSNCFARAAARFGATVLMATHSAEAAAIADVRVHLRDGRSRVDRAAHEAAAAADPASAVGAIRCGPLLTVLAVALGVAVVVAIDLAGDAATGSFRASLETLTGQDGFRDSRQRRHRRSLDRPAGRAAGGCDIRAVGRRPGADAGRRLGAVVRRGHDRGGFTAELADRRQAAGSEWHRDHRVAGQAVARLRRAVTITTIAGRDACNFRSWTRSMRGQRSTSCMDIALRRSCCAARASSTAST